MRHRSLAGWFFCCAVVLLGSVAGRAEEKPKFVFGVAMPLTGPNSGSVNDQVTALRWALEDINASGGAGGRKLEMAAVDSQSNPKLGIDVVTQLISVDKVPLIVSAISPVVAAVAPIVNREKVLMLVTGAQSPRISTLGDFVYTTYPLADVDVTILADYSAKTLHKHRAAVLYINDEAGIFAARVFRDEFIKQGGEVVAFESYDPKATDYTGPILKVKFAKPDIIHLHGNAGDTPQVLQQLGALGVDVPVNSYIAAYNPRILEQLGAHANGLVVPNFAPGPSDSPVVATYLARWKKEYGREPDILPVTQFVHDDAYIIKALVEYLDQKNLPLTGENFRTALLAIHTFDKLPLVGSITIRDDHTVKMPAHLLQAKDGAFVPIAVAE